jgi:membrane protein YqaA with SNARE-associated domain
MKLKLNKPLAIGLLIFSIALPILLFIFRDFFKDAQSLGLLGIFIINLTSNLSPFPEPGFISVFAGGIIYNPILVAIVASFGASIGDLLFFVIGYSSRHLSIERLRKKILFQVLEDYFKKYGGYILFFAALLPNPFFDAFGLIGGVFGFSPIRFFLIMTVGRFLRFLLVAGIGTYF